MSRGLKHNNAEQNKTMKSSENSMDLIASFTNNWKSAAKKT